MRERIDSSAVEGLVNKIFAFDKYSVDASKVSLTAYYSYLNRQRLNIPGSAEEDWNEAEKTVKNRLTREVRRKLAENHSF
jgi:hypothetical protein